MSAQGLLSSVFSCSLSPKTISKRRLRQTRSLDPALMRHHSAEGEAEASPYKVSYLAAAAHTCLPDASGRGDLLPVPDETVRLYGMELNLPGSPSCSTTASSLRRR
ncbi:putative rho GTPase-activating protein 6-like [Scophthalmus maximus]|uniref:Putative rho GTPase-activating protein 6-like n=1 Tax=Scophthalmus maximus TaxID=52904 RepID=A0A2U9C9E8_SCOMX|nr:putative rho GTPase-activating protein 6-like [Scophthalmus maximus]